MAIGTALKQARIRKGMTQDELGRAIYKSPTWISKAEHDEREPTPDTLAQMVAVLDDAAFMMAAMRHVTGGTFGQALDAVEGGRAAALLLAKVELTEAQEALKGAQAMLLRCPTRADRAVIIETVMEAMDARAALNQLLVCLCGEYSLSLREMGQRHDGRMLQKGYRKGRSHAEAATAVGQAS